jgi:tRNA (guanine-N7-)-methyltransferase
MSDSDELALIDMAACLIIADASPLDLQSVWGEDVPVVVEVGFGNGSATVSMAAADPGTGILAIDIHTPGVARLLRAIDENGLTNVRVIEGDALTVLERMIAPGSLAGVRSYFPDPWPKARHHKRRLVQAEVLALVGSRLVDGGRWDLATDWTEYVEKMQEQFATDPRWSGGIIDRPNGRPVTHFERRAIREGRLITDLSYCWSSTFAAPENQAAAEDLRLADRPA